MREMLIEGDEVCNVDVAVILFREDIFPNLIPMKISAHKPQVLDPTFIPVDEDIFEVELQDEINQFLLNLSPTFVSICTSIFAKQAERIH